MTRILNVVGCKNSGKTRTVEMLLPRLRALGLSVGTLKHTEHNNFHWDREGTDTYRHHSAGSEVSGIFGDNTLAIEINRAESGTPSLDQIIKTFYRGLDLVIIEGCKSHPAPKIEVCRPHYSSAPIVSDSELISTYGEMLFPRQAPHFAYGQEDALAEHILANRHALLAVG